jgi:PAS domain S-box-containing protein
MMPPFSTDQPRTVLIAASETYDVAPLRQMLGRYRVDVRAVIRGDLALAAAKAGGISLALVDVALAGSVNLELCRRLHTLPGGEMPVFLLSAHPDAEERERATEAGAAAYLPLSFNAEDLSEQVLLHLGVIQPAPDTPGMPTMATLQVNYHTMQAGSPDAILLMERGSNRILDINRRARQMFGLTESEMLLTDLPSLCLPVQADGQPAAQMFATHVKQVMAGDVQVFELAMRHSSGRTLTAELRMVPLNTPKHRLMHVHIVDISHRKRDAELRDGKNALLEMIARAAPLGETLDSLMRLIESHSEGAQCTVMLLSNDGKTVRPGAGPSMPQAYLQAIDGLPVGPQMGSCGTAIHRKQTVIVTDIVNDPLWAPFTGLAAQYGFRACWATPIMPDQHTVLGSFAMYYREVHTPTNEERRLVGAATHLAGIAIANARREEELQNHRGHLEELVSARTAELRMAKEDAEHANEELTTALGNLSMTQEELVRREKLASLGSLVAGVAHELNTPIGNSLVMASSMSERTAALLRDMGHGLRRSVLESYLQQAQRADEVVLRNLNRAAALVAGFKRIAVDGADNSQRRRFVLGDMFAELLQSVQGQMTRHGLTLVEDVDHWLELDSYPGPLRQALQNLIDNSLVHGFDEHEGRKDGSITLSAHDGGNGEIVIALADNGSGITAANLPRIYDPFFTTRLGSGGSGLGLYITHNIVTGVLGGRIDAVSTLGQGARFTMRLPRVAPR